MRKCLKKVLFTKKQQKNKYALKGLDLNRGRNYFQVFWEIKQCLLMSNNAMTCYGMALDTLQPMEHFYDLLNFVC